MTVEHFRMAARLSAPFLAAANIPVGQRIEAAVNATLHELKMNVNLGIILLAAPLIAARQVMVLSHGVDNFQHSLNDILENLTQEDAACVYRAIAAANPAGLGNLQRNDVREPPKLTLLQAMQISATRDRIAWQYSHGFVDILTMGVVRINHSFSLGLPLELVMTSCYLEFFSNFPDSHIERKYGTAKAIQIRDAAQKLVSMTGLGNGLLAHRQTLLNWDANLKSESINPGTTADLTVASLLASKLAA